MVWRIRQRHCFLNYRKHRTNLTASDRLGTGAQPHGTGCLQRMKRAHVGQAVGCITGRLPGERPPCVRAVEREQPAHAWHGPRRRQTPLCCDLLGTGTCPSALRPPGLPGPAAGDSIGNTPSSGPPPNTNPR